MQVATAAAQGDQGVGDLMRRAAETISANGNGAATDPMAHVETLSPHVIPAPDRSRHVTQNAIRAARGSLRALGDDSVTSFTWLCDTPVHIDLPELLQGHKSAIHLLIRVSVSAGPGKSVRILRARLAETSVSRHCCNACSAGHDELFAFPGTIRQEAISMLARAEYRRNPRFRRFVRRLVDGHRDARQCVA